MALNAIRKMSQPSVDFVSSVCATLSSGRSLLIRYSSKKGLMGLPVLGDWIIESIDGTVDLHCGRRTHSA
jgi:hypothetical protein